MNANPPRRMPLAIVLLLLAFLGLDAPRLGLDAAVESSCLHAYPFRVFENVPLDEAPEPEGWQADDQFDDDYLVEQVRVQAEASLPPHAGAFIAGRPRAVARSFVPLLAPALPPDCCQLARLLL
jgi:hypothetical protein